MMALTSSQLEALAAWCAESGDLTEAREAGRRAFFGADDGRRVNYWPGAGEHAARERRFLGWFMFAARLSDGRAPVEAAITELRLPDAGATARVVRQHRYVLAVVDTVLKDRVVLELEDERFEVRERRWTRFLRRDGVIAAHLIPVRPDVWLAGPGWVELPVTLGSDLRSHLKDFQPDAVDVERLLQGRVSGEPARSDVAEEPTLDEAVARMTALSIELECPRLALSVAQWTALVHRHFDGLQAADFFRDVVERAGVRENVDRAERVTAAAAAIWNATPQADRGGLTARELARLNRLRSDRSG